MPYNLSNSIQNLTSRLITSSNLVLPLQLLALVTLRFDMLEQKDANNLNVSVPAHPPAHTLKGSLSIFSIHLL